MKLYGAAQSGGGLQSVSPGERIVLFDGTETPVANITSLAFARAPGPTQVPAGIVFSMDFAAAPTVTMQIQGANVDTELAYQTLYTKDNTQHDYYQDAGNFMFYRAKVSAYTSGGMPTVIAQR